MVDAVPKVGDSPTASPANNEVQLDDASQAALSESIDAPGQGLSNDIVLTAVIYPFIIRKAMESAREATGEE